MEALKDNEIFTVEAIESLPEGQRAELIDGIIYDMASPGATHQRLVSFFDRTIGNYIEAKGGDCEVFPAPFAVYPNKDEYNYLEPDVFVVCDPSKIDEKGCHGAPDWVIEIVSPSSRTMDYLRKLFKYGKAGVREYWIVDPDKERVIVYRFGEEGQAWECDSDEKEQVEEYGFDEEIGVGIYDEDLTIRIRETI